MKVTRGDLSVLSILCWDTSAYSNSLWIICHAEKPLNELYHAYVVLPHAQSGFAGAERLCWFDWLHHNLRLIFNNPVSTVLWQISRNKVRNQQVFPLFPFRQQKVEIHKIISIQIQRYIYIFKNLILTTMVVIHW